MSAFISDVTKYTPSNKLAPFLFLSNGNTWTDIPCLVDRCDCFWFSSPQCLYVEVSANSLCHIYCCLHSEMLSTLCSWWPNYCHSGHDYTRTITRKESPLFYHSKYVKLPMSNPLKLHHSVLMYCKKNLFSSFHLKRRWKVGRNNVNVRSINIRKCKWAKYHYMTTNLFIYSGSETISWFIKTLPSHESCSILLVFNPNVLL